MEESNMLTEYFNDFPELILRELKTCLAKELSLKQLHKKHMSKCSGVVLTKQHADISRNHADLLMTF